MFSRVIRASNGYLHAVCWLRDKVRLSAYPAGALSNPQLCGHKLLAYLNRR